MSGSNVPDEPPPSYTAATGASSTTKPTASSNHLNVPGTEPSSSSIPPSHRRSMEDEQRPLPKGWVRTYDPTSNHQFFVNTAVDPPRSTWHHPYDDEEYLSTLSSEERERIEHESLGRGHPVSKADIIAHHTDDEDEDEHAHHAMPAKNAELPNEDAMYEMLEELKTAQEIAVDLEHHDQRSYIGIVSLMQISTRDKDWIVDTLKPWRRKLSCLNEVFADPGIIKVLHGAYMDIVWLQRDLGLYIVGLFDTHYASRALGYAGGSLAFLLDKFANVQAQKQYQTADWRIRPLPQELFDYARSDTHYLLYIFDCMRNELIQKSDFSIPDQENDKIWDVLHKSSETALQRYEHPVYDYELGQGPGGWYKMFSRTSLSLNKEEFAVLRAVHKWRDDTARQQDDSVHYIMANHQIIALARAMPTTRTELLNALSPCSVTVRLRADELVTVIANAKAAGRDGPEMTDVLNEVEAKFPRKHWYQQPAAHAIAPVVQQLKEDGTTFQVLPSSTLPLRSSISTFWGPAFGSSVHQTRDASSLSTVTLAVPLPPLTAEVFADTAEPLTPMDTTNPLTEDYTPAHEPVEAQDEADDVFMLKKMNRKRKRPEPASDAMPVDSLATQSDVIALPDEETERLQAKGERKRARKEAKKAKNALRSNGDVGDAEDDQQPFDYEAAPSILNPPRESREEIRERRKKEKNPWAKSMDAPKGLPRTQKESAGRSHTFKSVGWSRARGFLSPTVLPECTTAYYELIRPCTPQALRQLLSQMVQRKYVSICCKRGHLPSLAIRFREEEQIEELTQLSATHRFLTEYLRGTATTDECEPLFKQYKSCLGKALKERGIDTMVEEARADNKDNDIEYLKPSPKWKGA
nr:exosome complex exonuclease rrp6 [Quercus suber]